MPTGHTFKHAHRQYIYSMPAYHTSMACSQAEPTQCARRPHIYTCPQAILLQHARRPYICSMPAVQTFTVCPQATHLHVPAGYTYTTCPQAIHLHRARRPYIPHARRPRAHSMPAGHTCTACPQANTLAACPPAIYYSMPSIYYSKPDSHQIHARRLLLPATTWPQARPQIALRPTYLTCPQVQHYQTSAG